jgi:hypothetical protein
MVMGFSGQYLVHRFALGQASLADDVHILQLVQRAVFRQKIHMPVALSRPLMYLLGRYVAIQLVQSPQDSYHLARHADGTPKAL